MGNNIGNDIWGLYRKRYMHIFYVYIYIYMYIYIYILVDIGLGQLAWDMVPYGLMGRRSFMICWRYILKICVSSPKEKQKSLWGVWAIPDLYRHIPGQFWPMLGQNCLTNNYAYMHIHIYIYIYTSL